MTTLNDIENALSSHKKQLASRFGVKRLAIFGSYARNEQRRDSDVDILVEFDTQVGIEFIDLANFLEDILKIRVDLVSRNGIKPKYLNKIQPDLRYV
jgi:uncharacterized protein